MAQKKRRKRPGVKSQRVSVALIKSVALTGAQRMAQDPTNSGTSHIITRGSKKAIHRYAIEPNLNPKV